MRHGAHLSKKLALDVILVIGGVDPTNEVLTINLVTLDFVSLQLCMQVIVLFLELLHLALLVIDLTLKLLESTL